MVMAIKPAPSDLSRAKLAEAISKRDECERKLIAARDAAERARRSRWSAMNKLDALRQTREEACAAQELGTTFIASVLAGQPCGVATLERPASTRDEDALEGEIATWATTQAECDG